MRVVRSAGLIVMVTGLLLPVLRRPFFATGNRWLYVLFLSFSIAALLSPGVRWLAHRTGALDLPDGRRKIHDTPTALLGGGDRRLRRGDGGDRRQRRVAAGIGADPVHRHVPVSLQPRR